MKCPTCDSENAADARYCVDCGVSLDSPAMGSPSVAYCASCRSENPVEAQTCVRCGAEVHSPPHSDTPADVAPAPPDMGVPTGALPSRDIGELLSETFRLLRERFWLFAFISIWAQIPILIAQIPQFPEYVDLIFTLVGYALSVLAIGAMVFASAALCAGKDITVAQCYSRAWTRCLSLLGSGFIYLVALAVSGFLILSHKWAFIIGIPLLFFLLVSWFFYAQAIMLEGRKGPQEAIARSHQLVRHQWWRTFWPIVALIVIGVVINAPGLIALSYSWIAGTILVAIAGIVTTPMVYIGGTLVYFDLRVRKEGYTLETMATEVGL